MQGWESCSFHWNSGIFMVPRVILEIRLNLGRKFVCVHVHYNRELLTPCAPWSCSPVYPYSVCPDLALKHTVWKWSSIVHIHAFCGGLQARLWQAKIGLWSFAMQFSQGAHGLHEKTCLLCEMFAMRSKACEYVQSKSDRSNRMCLYLRGSAESVSKIDQRKSCPRKRNW